MIADRGRTESGAALLESVVALALVAVTVAGGARLHRATVEARLAAEATVVALGLATTSAERARSGIDTADLAIVDAPGPLWTRRSCDGTAAPGLLDVPVRPDGAQGSRGRLRVAVPPGRPAPHLVAVVDVDGSPVAGVAARIATADGEPRTAVTDAAGCLDLGPAGDPVVVEVDVGAGPAGRTAVAAPDATGARGGVPVVRAIERGAVTVSVDPGADLPDAVDDGSLAWWDPAGSAVTALGAATVLPVGRRTVVIGTCGDPRAGGTAAAVTVDAGAGTTVVVRPGILLVPRPGVADGRRLVLRRLRPCPGVGPGSGARPTLRWELGPGAEPLRAAVPDGAWEASLEGPTGARIRGPVPVLIAGPDAADPPW